MDRWIAPRRVQPDVGRRDKTAGQLAEPVAVAREKRVPCPHTPEVVESEDRVLRTRATETGNRGTGVQSGQSLLKRRDDSPHGRA